MALRVEEGRAARRRGARAKAGWAGLDEAGASEVEMGKRGRRERGVLRGGRGQRDAAAAGRRNLGVRATATARGVLGCFR